MKCSSASGNAAERDGSCRRWPRAALRGRACRAEQSRAQPIRRLRAHHPFARGCNTRSRWRCGASLRGLAWHAFRRFSAAGHSPPLFGLPRLLNKRISASRTNASSTGSSVWSTSARAPSMASGPSASPSVRCTRARVVRKSARRRGAIRSCAAASAEDRVALIDRTLGKQED